jgi:7-cyano-7-deazaguanine reductase
MSIDTHLGQTSQYDSTYDPSLLVTELRQTNRDSQNITSTMDGVDVWNVYEVSFLTKKGLPVNGVGKITYSSQNEVIVESKSLKLYFFSLNMERVGETKAEAIEIITQRVTDDLSRLLNTQVRFKLFEISTEDEPFGNYLSINDNLDDVEFTDVTENPSLLSVTDGESKFSVTSNLLRSNCKITNQPDYGDVFIFYNGPKKLDMVSLAKYLVSFRSENHFHEEVCEMIYDRLNKALEPTELLVACRYTRRGGIDINPIRVSSASLLPDVYVRDDVQLKKLQRQ